MTRFQFKLPKPQSNLPIPQSIREIFHGVNGPKTQAYYDDCARLWNHPDGRCCVFHNYRTGNTVYSDTGRTVVCSGINVKDQGQFSSIDELISALIFRKKDARNPFANARIIADTSQPPVPEFIKQCPQKHERISDAIEILT